MIQRMQSLYLLMAAVFMVIMLFVPLGKFSSGDAEFILHAFGLKSAIMDGYIVRTLYMGILIVMAAVLPFINIFLYSNRMLQIRLCFMEFVLLLGVQIFVVYYLYHAHSSVQVAEHNFSVYTPADIFPVVSIIFTWLALRGIMKDESLVRSLDRIR